MASTYLPEYSPSRVTVAWDGLAFQGFAEDFISVNYNSDITSHVTGADGKVAITVSPDKTGTIDISLLQTSPTNLYLAEIVRDQDEGTLIYRADLSISDPSGSFAMEAKSAHIMQRPEYTLGIEHNTRTWSFFCEEMIIKVPDQLSTDIVDKIRSDVSALGESFVSKALDEFIANVSNNVPR